MASTKVRTMRTANRISDMSRDIWVKKDRGLDFRVNRHTWEHSTAHTPPLKVKSSEPLNHVYTILPQDPSPLPGFLLGLVSSPSKLTASVVRPPDFESDTFLYLTRFGSMLELFKFLRFNYTVKGKSDPPTPGLRLILMSSDNSICLTLS